MTARSQRLAALNNATRRRRELGEYRRALRSGAVSIEDAMLNPPEFLRDRLLIDVVRDLRGAGAGSATRSGLAEIGRRAVRDGVNLLLPVGRASLATRAWVAAEATVKLTGPRVPGVGVNSAPEHKSARRCANTPGHGNEGVSFDAAAA